MNQAQLRRQVLLRDAGICSLCGLDTLELSLAYRCARVAAHNAHDARCAEIERETAHLPPTPEMMTDARTSRIMASALQHADELRAIDQRLERLGFHASDGDFWQCDHVVPLIEGGTNTLENARTLCSRCHREVSAELAARLKRRLKKRLWKRGEDRSGRAVIR